VVGVLIGLSLAAHGGAPLAIQPAAGNQVQVAWPAGTNFDILQELLGFASTNDWRDVSEAPFVFGARYGLMRGATNTATFYRLVSRGTPGSPTPPDPSTTASVPAPNTFNDHASLTAFLYTGSNAVQVGMGAGAIDPVRSSVLRGKVKKRDNSPLPGVRVAILNHAEFGYTVTRTDGMFDLAVNAGNYTVDLQAIGYCPAQRQVQAPMQDFRTLSDVVMVGMDPMANPITFGSNTPAQTAHSSVITDGDGTRSVSILFPAGTSAKLVMGDGSVRACNGLTVRATEFTVGANGPAAMPGPLPSTSAYTYCAEFSGDEALDAGARSIVFDQTVWGYLDNFLGIAVGSLVPAGSYDRQRAAWIPESNGRVIQILGVTAGLARVDVDGSGVPADSATLAANQFSAAELQQLAANYPSGTTLWRMPMAHFTAIDWNFGFWWNKAKSPNTPGDRPKTDPCDTCPSKFGTVNYTSQIFEETIPLVGASMALHYSSARVPGYHLLANAVVPVASGDELVNLRSVEVRSEIAGVVTDLSYGGSPTSPVIPEFTALSWDGYDAYGRFLGGTRNASTTVTFLYPTEYSGLAPITGWASFALFSNFGQEVVGSGHTGTGLDAKKALFDRLFTIPDHRAVGLGGWSLTPHHLYDPESNYLYLGDGRVLKPEHLGNAIEELSGLETFIGSSGAVCVSAAADGTLFFYGTTVRGLGNALFKRTPNGQYAYISCSNSVSGVIGVGEDWSAADGRPASQLSLAGGIGQIEAGPDGSLYVRTVYTIARIDNGGMVHIVLGMGSARTTYPPDGTLGRAAFGTSTEGGGVVAVGPDGTVYYDDAWTLQGTNYNFIRKVAPDGRIYTVTGQGGPLSGTSWVDEMGKPADQAGMNKVQSLALGRDGSVYISPITGFPFEGGIYKITPGGSTEMVMANIPVTRVGNEGLVTTGDEGSSAASPTNGVWMPGASARSLRVTPDGSVFFLADYSLTSCIWRITPNGLRERLAGRGPGTTAILMNTPQQSGNPLNTELYYLNDFAVGPDGGLTLVTQSGFNWSPLMTMAHIGPSLPGFIASAIEIPSENGNEVYVFDEHGRHLLTLNGLTGTTNWVFSYNTLNLVTDLTDANGLVTHIQRDAAGTPNAIVGPYGQQTVLGLDAKGFLSLVRNPADEATTLVNTTNGLLSSITGPLNHGYTVLYDTNGLVTQVRDPLGGGIDVSQTNSGNQVSVTSVTTLTNLEARLLTLQADGDTQISAAASDGTFATTLLRIGGGQSIQYSDGLSGEYTFAGDPRFPRDTRLLTSESLTLPGGLVNQLTVSRSTTTVDANNPSAWFPIVSITNQATLNGQVYTRTYNGSNGVVVTTSPLGRQLSSVLDDQGRLVHFQAPGRSPLDISYDAQGRVSAVNDAASVGARRTTFGYDAFGRLATLIDPLNRTNQYRYDSADRLLQLRLVDGQVAGYGRDAELRLTSVTPPGQPAHRFDYNAVGLVTNYTPPVVNGRMESVGYKYDADRALTQLSLPDGQNVVFTRGPLGRLSQLALGNGPVLTYTYSPQTGLASNIVSSTGDSLHFAYSGSFPTLVTWSGSIIGSVGLALNADFMVASQTVNGAAVTFGYDHDRLLMQAGSLAFTRDPASGFLTGTTLGGVSDTRQFDDRGLLTNYTATANGVVVWSIALRYDLINRLTNKTETSADVTRTFQYVYDVAGRLKEVWQNGGLATTYTYDANGNRLSRNTDLATYDAQDRVQALGDTTFLWSPNGDLHARTSGGQTTTYTYDVRGALTAVSPQVGLRIDYVIDGFGRRIGKKIGGSLAQGFLYQAFLSVAELDATNQVISRFVYGSKSTVPDYVLKNGSTYRILSDERSSVRWVVNVADGSVAQKLDYDEFGRVTTDTTPGFQPFGFAGGLYDPDTGLVRFGLRDYAAETGQWTARDPIRFEGGQFSLYSYVGNDPLNRMDPLGTGPFSLSNPNPGSLFAGLSGGGGSGLGFTVSGGMIIDTRGNIGLSFTAGGGPVLGVSAKAVGTATLSQGDIYSTGGRSTVVGGTAGEGVVGGVDGVWNVDGHVTGISGNVGFGVEGTVAEGHGFETGTGVIGVNLFGLYGALTHPSDPFGAYYSAQQPKANVPCP